MKENMNELYYQKLEEIVTKFEKQLLGFDMDTNCENPIQIVLKGHLYIEHEMRALLERSVKNPNILNIDRLKFSELSKLIFSLGMIPIEVYPPIKHINVLRNQYAHNLEFVFSEDDLNGLIKTFSNDVLHKYNLLMERRNNPVSIVDKLQIAVFTIWNIIVDYSMVPDEVKKKLDEDLDIIKRKNK